MDADVPEPVRSAVDAWLTAHDQVAPGVVEGLYLVGSAVLDDWQPSSDIDIVAFVADPTDADVVDRLRAAHDTYRSEPGRTLVDGPFLSWADVGSPPLAAQRAWSLDGGFHFDGECFEINPVTWYTLATYGIAVRGPSAGELDVVADAADRRTWVRENVDTYWRAVLEQVRHAFESDPDRTQFDPAMHEWCALGIARMAYTFETADVTSKSGAGEWLSERRPAHADVLWSALEIRRESGGEAVDRAAVAELIALLADEVEHITGS